MSKTVRPAVLILAVGSLAFALGYVVFPHAEAGHDAPNLGPLALDPGAPAPDFLVNYLDGTELHSQSLEGQIVIVDFWATWCGPCLTEIPHYNALHADYENRGVKMLGITLQSGSTQQVEEWLSQPIRLGAEEYSLEYPIVMGNDMVEASWGPIYGFPMTYLVDSDWKIRKKWLGAVPNKSDQLRYLIDQLLEERGALASDD